jgi:hypothetical protein
MGTKMPPPATNGPVIAGYFANWYLFQEKPKYSNSKQD